jgi:hypothetical protein
MSGSPRNTRYLWLKRPNHQRLEQQREPRAFPRPRQRHLPMDYVSVFADLDERRAVFVL